MHLQAWGSLHKTVSAYPKELSATTVTVNRPNLFHLENTIFTGLFAFEHILADMAIAVHIKLGYRLSPDGLQSLTVDTENIQTDAVL